MKATDAIARPESLSLDEFEDELAMVASHLYAGRGAVLREDANDPAGHPAGATGPGLRLPFPGLRKPPLPRCASHPPLGARRADHAHEPDVALPPPPPARGDPGELLRRQRELGIHAGAYASGDGQPMELREVVDLLLATST
jgi:hypothetical protein